MTTLDNLPRPALLAIGEAVDLLTETTRDVYAGYGDPADMRAYTNRLNALCAEHGVDPHEAVETFR